MGSLRTNGGRRREHKQYDKPAECSSALHRPKLGASSLRTGLIRYQQTVNGLNWSDDGKPSLFGMPNKCPISCPTGTLPNGLARKPLAPLASDCYLNFQQLLAIQGLSNHSA